MILTTVHRCIICYLRANIHHDMINLHTKFEISSLTPGKQYNGLQNL